MRDYYRKVTPRQKLCFNCTLPECYEDDPGCAYRAWKPPPGLNSGGQTSWKAFYAQIARLAPGDQRQFTFDSYAIARNARTAVHHYRRRHLPADVQLTTHTQREPDRCHLFVKKQKAPSRPSRQPGG